MAVLGPWREVGQLGSGLHHPLPRASYHTPRLLLCMVEVIKTQWQHWTHRSAGGLWHLEALPRLGLDSWNEPHSDCHL